MPLEFNKLDFRDYLWNVYKVQVKGVRSFINPSPPIQNGDRMGRGMWTRRKPEKMMKVELVKPFVWPDKPEELDEWDNRTFTEVDKEQERQLVAAHRNRDTSPVMRDENSYNQDLHVKLMRMHAQELLSGKRTWKSGATLDEKWGEVEKDVDVAKLEGEKA